MSEIGRKILEIASNPELLYSLTPIEFEQVMAELLASFGWRLSPTSRIRDGERDILGVQKDISGLTSTWIIECKRYSSQNMVGVSILRNLYGIKQSIRVSNALLATSSSLTKGARQFASATYDLQVADFNRITGWVKQYTPSQTGDAYLLGQSFYTCFISHSHKDQDFAEQLTAQLRKEGIAVWYAPEDLLPGKKIYEEVDHAIKLFDKLLVVLSRNSMNSEWVKTEIRKARKRETAEGRKLLFPIALASIEEIKEWECFDADIGKDIAVELREYLIPDFSNWRDQNSFEYQLQRLLRGLRPDWKPA